jgi:molecular chaperone GrpE
MSEENKEIKNNEELEKCRTQAEEYLSGWKRAKADLVNYQKDEARRFEEVIKFANKEFMKEAIVVLDSFDLAIGTLGEKAEKGFVMIRAQLADILKKHGLEQIKIEAGAPFDAAYHEALMEVDSTHPPGTVVEEIEKGYMLHGQVVRPSRVKISKS